MAQSTAQTPFRFNVRFSADDALYAVDVLDADSFRIAGDAFPPGVWLMATLQRSAAVGVRIPVVAGHVDASNRQIFTAATEAGRHLLGILSVQTTLPPADVGTLPPARVLPPTIPVRPFIVRRLH
jgi:hypothetical protein